MDGLSQETLAFLIDIQQHGANNLRSLSEDFGSLSGAADRISKQLVTLQSQLDRTAASSAAAGEKVAASAKGAATATDAQTKATEGLTTVQRSQVGQADAVTAATDKLTKAQKASADAGKAEAAGLDATAAASQRAGSAAAGAATGTRKHSSALDEHSSRLKKAQDGIGGFGRAMTAATLPIAAVSGVAIKMGLDFEGAMERLHGQAGYAQKDIAGLEAAVLKAAPHLARTPNELAEALYHVASVGVPAAHAMQVVTAASIAANIGNANLEETTNGLVIVMKSLHQPASMAKEDMALLNEVVGAGNLRMNDLVGSLGKVLPQAQSFGLNLRDVGAAMDVMTSRGINAEMAATRLGMTFNLMGNPSATAQKSLATIGLSSNKLAEDMHKPDGLLVAVEDLKHHLDDTFPASGSRKLSVDEERSALLTYKKQLEETGVSGKKLTTDLEEYADKLVHMGSAAVEQSQVLSNSFGRGRQSATVLTLVQNVDDLRKMYAKLPEGEKALERLANAQEDWEKTSTGQFDTAKASISASMTEIGKSLGPVVVPVIKDLASDVSGLVKDFQSLPAPVQHVIESIAGLTAVIGPAAVVTSKFIGAGRAIGGVVGGVAGRFGSSAAPVAEDTLGGAETAASRFMGIYGVRGPAEAGSLLNPIAVQMVGMGGSLGGGPSVLSQAERDAAGAERSPGGVLLPSGVNLAEDAAVAAPAAVGLGSRVLTIGKSVAGGVLKGGAIALGGMAAADIAGSVVGGKTGHDISSIGTDAAMGAGLGSLIGPEGTVAGAVGGALVGGLKALLDRPSFGQQMADTLGKGLNPGAQKAIANTFNAFHQSQDPMRYNGPRGYGGSGRPLGVQESNKEAYAGGSAIAAGIEQQAAAFKFPDLKSVTGQVEKYLSQVPARARSAGIQSIVEWTAGMQSQGRLPVGSTQQIIESIEKKWPEYTTYLRSVGMSSMKELAQTIEGKQAVEAAKKQVGEISQTFQGLAPLLKADGGNIQQEWGTTLDYLVGQTHSKMPQVRAAAESELKKMRSGTATLMTGWQSQLTQNFAQAGSKGAAAFEQGMETLVGNIRKGMAHGLLSVQEGDALIDKALAGELKAMNGGHVSSLAEGGPPLAPGVEKALKGATGMRVPGAVGPDNVGIFAPGGGLRGVVAGGELLVANRHTEGRVDHKLAVGAALGLWDPTSLGSEVAGETRPHDAPRYAKGGFIADPGTVQNVGKLPQITSDLQRMGEAMGWEVYGISGYRSPQHSVEVGGFPNDPHTRGEAEDVGINSQTLESARVLTAFILARFGLERPFYPASAHEVNHIQLLGSGIPGGAREALSIAQAAVTSAMHAIKVPKWNGPGGAIGAIGHSALVKATKAANAQLRAAGAGGNLSGFKGGGSPTANETLGRKMMLADGWDAGEWPSLQALWTQESGWNDESVNPSSGAYGIPQSLGHGHPYDLGDAPAQIAWGLHYIRERYGSPSAAEDHEKAYNWYSHGGRMNYAGAFAHGGVAHASSPTMAVFGENGPETAIFVPHMQTGGELLESIGVTPTAPAGSKKVEGLNPDNNQIEYRTEAEWKNIRLHHSQAQHAKGGATQYEDQIQVGRIDVGSILSKTKGTINVPGDVARLSAETWKKVVSAIEHTLKETGGPANAAFDVQATGQIARHAHSARTRQLANASIQASAKTILTVTKNLPAEDAVAGGDAAINQLRKLIADARVSGNRNLVGALTKDIQSTIKTTAAGIMQNVTNAPAGQAAGAAAAGVKQLQALVTKARANGSKTVELALLKDIQKTVAAWQSAISTSLSTSTSATTAHENLKVARTNLARVKALGGGAQLTSGSGDSTFLKEQEHDQEAARAQMEQERTVLSKLVKQLDAKMRTALKKHHKAQAKAIEAEIHEIDAQLGEVATSIDETTTNIAQLQIEFAQKVYEEVKSRIAEAQATFENASNNASIRSQITQQNLHNQGLDLSGLQEDASKQGGVLTPGQVQQANTDLQSFIAGVHEQEQPLMQQRAYDQEHLGELTGSDRTTAENQILALTLQIAQLQGSIVDQSHATEQLTEATKASTNTMAQFTGSVTYAYQGQQYVVGQTSDLANTPSVGL